MTTMGRTVSHLSISLDGFVAGPDQGLEHPYGLGGYQLHEWARHADEPGSEADRPLWDELLRPMGAFVMGRNMFGPIRGEWIGAASTSSRHSGCRLRFRFGSVHSGGGAGDRTRVRSRVPCDIYERSPGFYLAVAAPWDQARRRPASVNVPPGAEAPPGGETACINVGSVPHSRRDGRRQAEA